MKRVFRFRVLILASMVSAVLPLSAQTLVMKKMPEPYRHYLLLGLQVSPKADGISNMWVVSEGGDFSLFGPLRGGYEIGMFHRVTDAQLEYRFKTFFNFKFGFFRDKRVGGYLGAGGGLLEVLRTTRLKSGFDFILGYQAILGLRIGPPVKDNFILEFQAIATNKADGGPRFHILAGTRF